MTRWYFYTTASGVFTGASYATAAPVQEDAPTNPDKPPAAAVEPDPPDLAVNTPPGCSAWRADDGLDWRVWQVQGGALVPYTPPPPPLEVLKKRKLREMRAAAVAADQADITLSGNTFAADSASRAQLYNEALVAQMNLIDGQAFSLTWERADGSAVTLTAAQLKAIIRAIRQRTDDIRAQFRARRQAINAATTQAQVEAVAW
jgi:hypothetical protein